MKALTVHVANKNVIMGFLKISLQANEFAFASCFPEMLSGITTSATPLAPCLPARGLYSLQQAHFVFVLERGEV